MSKERKLTQYEQLELQEKEVIRQIKFSHNLSLNPIQDEIKDLLGNEEFGITIRPETIENLRLTAEKYMVNSATMLRDIRKKKAEIIKNQWKAKKDEAKELKAKVVKKN